MSKTIREDVPRVIILFEMVREAFCIKTCKPHQQRQNVLYKLNITNPEYN